MNHFSFLPLLFTSFLLTIASPKPSVTESARQIPVAYDADVVVVGGSSGGVAAAVEAAKSGASVFLLSSRSYLGEDMCGTYRLWLETNETPVTALGQALFSLTGVTTPFTYTSSVVADTKHPDSSNTILTDGKFSSAASQSVQYNANTDITLKLAAAHDVSRVNLLVYQDAAYAVEYATVSVSSDGTNWTAVTTVPNDELEEGAFTAAPITMSAEINRNCSWIKLEVRKPAAITRMLLAEITVEIDAPPVLMSPANPLHVKQTLDAALISNNVAFLLESYPTDVLRDAGGKPCGIVMANRAGRQAVRAKVIIDATPRATVARMLDAGFTSYPAGPQQFQRIVYGGTARSNTANLQARTLTPNITADNATFTATEYTLTIPMADDSFASFAEAEQIARDMTFQTSDLGTQKGTSEFLFQIPPDHMTGVKTVSGSWPGAENIDLDVFRPNGISNVFVIGGCADISRTAAERLLRPLELIRTGYRIGAAAGTLAGSFATPVNATVVGKKEGKTHITGNVRELLRGPRTTGENVLAYVSSPERSLPVIGQYDVVVIGGGTGGAPAGIGAARQGARTLVVEYLHGLGGIGTLGMIDKYWHGNRVGFTAEMDATLTRSWLIENKMEWYRSKLREAGGDLWLCSMGTGVLVEDTRVKGVIVTTPLGRGVVLCNTVVDSTGNADIAIAAGAQYRFAGDDVFALQGTGLSKRLLGENYANSDWTYVNDSDVSDRTRTHVTGRSKYKGISHDISPLIASRERKSIIGDYTLDPLNIIKEHTFSDTIAKTESNWDAHGYTIHPLFQFYFPLRDELFRAYVSYRCLLPQGVEGILVTGIGSSFQRDAAPVVRMQADVQNQGYAAGVAAAMASKNGTIPRNIDVNALQQHLVDIGNLDAAVLTHTDFVPSSAAQVDAALQSLASGQDYGTVLSALPETALPKLRQSYQNTTNQLLKVKYARLLAVLNDATGYETLLTEVQSRSWDAGVSLPAYGNHGSGLSELDSIIIQLGQLRNPAAVPAIAAKLDLLTNVTASWSHFRACAVALGTIGSEQAAVTLAAVLNKDGMSGHAVTSLAEAVSSTPASATDKTTRASSLRELLLATALFQCGDSNGLGENILRQYINDVHGVYSMYAKRVLGEP